MRGRERVISRQKPDLARDETRVSADVGEKKKFKFETFLQNQLNFSAIFTLFFRQPSPSPSRTSKNRALGEFFVNIYPTSNRE